MTFALVTVVSVVILTACGGSGGSSGAVADAENVETGKVIASSGWSVELIQAPAQAKIIGEGSLTYQSETGTYLVVFAKVQNTSGNLQVVPRGIFTLRDGAGNEYKASKSAIQVAYVQSEGKRQGLDILLDSPMPANEERDGVLIFEIPTDAAGLSLFMEGASDSLKLGF